MYYAVAEGWQSFLANPLALIKDFCYIDTRISHPFLDVISKFKGIKLNSKKIKQISQSTIS